MEIMAFGQIIYRSHLSAPSEQTELTGIRLVLVVKNYLGTDTSLMFSAI